MKDYKATKERYENLKKELNELYIHGGKYWCGYFMLYNPDVVVKLNKLKRELANARINLNQIEMRKLNH